MIGLAVAAAVVAVIVALAQILPCPACEKRRQRIREAYTKWQAEKDR